MLDYQKTRYWTSPLVHHHYTRKDSILYALGVGLGGDGSDERQLRFVYEKNLAAVPTMVSVLASPGFWMRDDSTLGIDYLKLVHAEQHVHLHAPLPPEGVLVGQSRVVGVTDKGEGKGAILYVQKELCDAGSGRLVATAMQAFFCRGDGGCAGEGGGDAPATTLQAVPMTPPHRSAHVTVRPDAAMLYRLSGDLNPLHIDPSVAIRAGFTRPILQGLATYGMACQLLLKTYCDYDPGLLTSFGARLSAPVFPGETLHLDFWESGDEISFQARVVERDVVVLSHGHAKIAASWHATVPGAN